MLNQCSFIGRLGSDPEIRSFSNGGKVANMRIAVSERFKDRNTGEQRERTEWITIAVYVENLVRVCEQYLKKGSRIFVQGQLETRKWQSQDGSDRYSTEVALRPFRSELHMLDGKQGDQRRDDNQSGGSSGQQGGSYAGGYDDGSDIPFIMEWRL